MTEIQRQEIYLKYKKHCAYCGNPLEYSAMEVDHINPIAEGGVNSKSNFNPSCGRCNHYKRAHSLETFRRMLKSLDKRVKDTYLNKIASDYGIIQFCAPWDGVFYFEKF